MSPSSGVGTPLAGQHDQAQCLATHVAGVRPLDEYHVVRIDAGPIAAQARPGQFVMLAPERASTPAPTFLPRPYAVHNVTQVGPQRGAIDVVVSGTGRGGSWLSSRRAGDSITVTGPLGVPFPAPERPSRVVLVGGGYGSAPLIWWARALRGTGSRVHVVMGAATQHKLFGASLASEAAQDVTIVTEDASAGLEGTVVDALPQVLDAHRAQLVYCCGPSGMLAAVHHVCQRRGVTCVVSLGTSMACGVGLCGGCQVPMITPDGTAYTALACVEGPVVNSARVRWEDVERASGYLLPKDGAG